MNFRINLNAKVPKVESRKLVCRNARYGQAELGGGQNRFMECPNAKAYMVYPEDFGIKILNSLTKYTRQFKKANHENWYNRSY